MYFVYLKESRKSDEIRAQIFQEMPKADCAVLPKSRVILNAEKDLSPQA